MWIRRSPEEIKRIALTKVRAHKRAGPASALAAFCATITVFCWIFGLPMKGSTQMPDASTKSWQEIVTLGPLYFLIMFGVFFGGLYAVQRILRRGIAEPEKTVFICPRCHTVQYRDERQCTCNAELEPFENWKWSEKPHPKEPD